MGVQAAELSSEIMDLRAEILNRLHNSLKLILVLAESKSLAGEGSPNGVRFRWVHVGQSIPWRVVQRGTQEWKRESLNNDLFTQK